METAIAIIFVVVLFAIVGISQTKQIEKLQEDVRGLKSDVGSLQDLGSADKDERQTSNWQDQLQLKKANIDHCRSRGFTKEEAIRIVE